MSASTSLNSSVPARDIGYGVVQAICKTISYNTPGIGTASTVIVGTLPAGAVLSHASVAITAAFNAVTSNVLIVGTSADDDAYVNAGDVDETVVGGTLVPRPAGVYLTEDTIVYVKFTETGTAATAGTARIVLSYVQIGNG